VLDARPWDSESSATGEELLKTLVVLVRAEGKEGVSMPWEGIRAPSKKES
jgi:hypothetical protein